MSGDPWQEYLHAARRLAAARREATAAADERAIGSAAVRERLAVVRERLAPQRTRLRERGVPEVDLVPSPPELSIATRSAGREPVDLLTALRQADERVTAADTTLDARGWRLVRSPDRPRPWSVAVALILLAGVVAVVLLLAG